jgi:hypothetical protein
MKDTLPKIANKSPKEVLNFFGSAKPIAKLTKLLKLQKHAEPSNANCPL